MPITIEMSDNELENDRCDEKYDLKLSFYDFSGTSFDSDVAGSSLLVSS